MISLLLASTPVGVTEQVNALPLALKLAGSVYLTFAVAIFLVTRLNRDR
jgi:hypothetical protein